MVVLPVPGPPLMTTSRWRSASAAASFCQSGCRIAAEERVEPFARGRVHHRRCGLRPRAAGAAPGGARSRSGGAGRAGPRRPAAAASRAGASGVPTTPLASSRLRSDARSAVSGASAARRAARSASRRHTWPSAVARLSSKAARRASDTVAASADCARAQRFDVLRKALGQGFGRVLGRQCQGSWSCRLPHTVEQVRQPLQRGQRRPVREHARGTPVGRRQCRAHAAHEQVAARRRSAASWS